MPVVLVVEDDQSTLDSLARGLRLYDLDVVTAQSAEEAVTRLSLTRVDVVVSDVMMGKMSGIDLLAHVRETSDETQVILVTAYGTIESAVEAVQLGAFDYMTKPINLARLELLVRRAVGRQRLVRENRELREQLRAQFSATEIIGQSRPMREILQQVEQIAPTSASVLVQGESGTGKELVARAIHEQSQRADQPFIVVNCVALAESLIESELFGHERGAFTGALATRRGRFEQASGGTLFLDEVGDLNVATQLKLLRAIQEREIERVGGQTIIPVDVRLIAATNRDLVGAMADGAFREELYYRLKVVTVQIPPLRERREDISPLIDHFLRFYCDEHGKTIQGFSQQARQELTSYNWPGNVRELRNLVENLVVTTRRDQISAQQLPSAVSSDDGERFPSVVVPVGRTLADAERAYLLKTLQAMNNNKARTAQVLGIAKKTLYNRLHAYGFPIDGDGGGGEV